GLGPSTAATDAVAPLDLPYQEAMKVARERAAQSYLEALMRRFHGHVTRAAEHAGMERESLHRLLRKHGIDADAYRSG
ncbi:MAG: sigma-54-dependent Fis family transcriptional regulator, partial [Deltaproteobacteria bacterium]